MRLYLRHDGGRADSPSNPPCRHEWIGAHLPMEAEHLAVLLAGVRCPACGGGTRIVVVEAREPTVAEALSS